MKQTQIILAGGAMQRARFGFRLGTWVAMALVFSLPGPPSIAADSVEDIRTLAKVAGEQIIAAEEDAGSKKTALAKKYVTALAGLEKTLAARGALDVIVHLREELASVERTGSTTAHGDKEIVETRDKYLKGLSAIDADFKLARGKVVESFEKLVKSQETALTKALKIEDALRVRNEGALLGQQLAGGKAVMTPAAGSDADLERIFEQGGSVTLRPLSEIKWPDAAPSLVAKPFDGPARWSESLTMPPGNLKLPEKIILGGREIKANVILAVTSSNWTSGKADEVEVSLGKFIATKSRFKNLRFSGDLSSELYFKDCALDGCKFYKGGGWFGGEQASKFYFQNCLIKGSFNRNSNVVDTGFRAEQCVFQGIQFERFSFRGKDPAKYLNEKWLRLVNCRFVDCAIPSSVVMLTRDCIFENCTLIDDARDESTEESQKRKDAETTFRSFEVVVYLKASQVKAKELPKFLTLTQKADRDLTSASIPTAATIATSVGM